MISVSLNLWSRAASTELLDRPTNASWLGDSSASASSECIIWDAPKGLEIGANGSMMARSTSVGLGSAGSPVVVVDQKSIGGHGEDSGYCCWHIVDDAE